MKNHKINLIDLGVILVVVLFALGIGIRLFSGTTASVNTFKTYEYKVAVEGVREYTVDSLKKLGKVTDEKNTCELGEIVAVEEEPHMLEVTTLSGEPTVALMPERFKCIVTINSDAKDLNGRLFINDKTELAIGKTFEIATKYAKTSGTIISVSEK